MRQALSVLLLTTLLAPLFPFSLQAQEIGSSTPLGQSSEEAPLIAEELAPVAVDQPYLGEMVEEVFEPTVRDGASTTPQFIEEGNWRMMRQSFSVESAPAGEEAALYRQVSAYTSNGTVAIGVRSTGTFEYQAGVSYTPAETQVMGAVSFVIGRSGERTGHIHAEVWYNGARVAASENRDVSEFSTYNSINASQEDFEAGLEKFIFATPVTLLAGENYQIVAGAGDDLSGYLDTWVSFTPAAYPVAQQIYANSAFREILNANFILYGAATGTPECVENCYSNVLFLPGIEGSALKESSNLLWPSSVLSQDGEQLRLSDSGESINDVKVAGVIGEFIPGVDVYGGFAAYMDGLVGNQTINEWIPFSYDWRLALDKTLEEGVNKEGNSELVRLTEEIERLAGTSKSGKVTIVAHSMGGLLGKMLIKKLESEGKAGLIDDFIMVGTPQLGTPEAIAALLHGEQPMSMGLFMRSHAFRSIARNMGSAYALLPSVAYMETNAIPPVITFDPAAAFTQQWRNRWGTSIDNASELNEFLSGIGVIRSRPNETNLAEPEVLRSEILNDVEALHAEIDDYVFPPNIRVVQIAGWGLPTVKSVIYKNKHIFFDGYDVAFTREGDKTVVYTSSLSSAPEEKYYFNLFDYNDVNNQHSEHRDLTSTTPVQSIIASVLKGEPVASTYITTEKPNPGSIEDQLLVSTKSPVVIGAHDSFGNFTGIDPVQDLDAETLKITEEIPGSSFVVAGEDMYLFLPKEGTYTFAFQGTDTGPATVEVGSFSNDVVVPKTVYTDIPVNPSTKGLFSINSATSEDIFIEVDSNGDGQIDSTVAPDGYVPPTPPPPTIGELILKLKLKVQGLNISPKLKTNLLKRIEQIENKLEKQKNKKSKILEKLEASIVKKAGKGKIDAASSTDIIALLDELESHAGVFPLDSLLLQQLRTKITDLDIKPKPKNDLLKRVERLEKTSGLTQALLKLTDNIVKKGVNGKIPDADVQELLNLLEQIESAL